MKVLVTSKPHAMMSLAFWTSEVGEGEAGQSQSVKAASLAFWTTVGRGGGGGSESKRESHILSQIEGADRGGQIEGQIEGGRQTA